MFAESPKQQLEPRSRGVGYRVRSTWRWVFGVFRPVNPFRTATGIAVTGQSETHVDLPARREIPPGPIRRDLPATPPTPPADQTASQENQRSY